MATLVEAVHAVGVEADRRASETESLRRLPDDLAAQLVATQLFRGWVPKRYGGAESDLLTVLDAIEALAYHDGATGWCGMIGATTSLTSGRLPAEWAETIYGDPLAVTGGYALPAGTARPVEGGGFQVDGRWQWGSFSHHCTWIGGGCFVAETRTAPFVFFAPEQVELLDTWHVAGLKGTGSTDYVVRDAFVPEGRWTNVLGGPLEDGPLYRFPLLGALALGVCSVALGLARRAEHELVTLAADKTPAQSGRTLAERHVVQAQVAKAEATRRAARALVRETVEECWTAAAVGELTGEHKRRLRLAATHATWASAEAVDLMYHAGGGSSIHEASPLQRVFRDVHVATQHGMVAERTYEPLGRMALGLPTDTSTL